MEFGHPDDSKCSSEETDRSDQTSDEAGTGRSYGCVFCKRGFTTAQALGGHMNIHRKDRAKTRPANSSIFPIPDETYVSLSHRSYLPISTYPQHYYPVPESHIRFQPYFPATTSIWGTTRASYGHDNIGGFCYQDPPNPMMYAEEEEWQHNLSLQVGVGPSNDVIVNDGGNNKGKSKIQVEKEDDDELDLELRLGHDP